MRNSATAEVQPLRNGATAEVQSLRNTDGAEPEPADGAEPGVGVEAWEDSIDLLKTLLESARMAVEDEAADQASSELLATRLHDSGRGEVFTNGDWDCFFTCIARESAILAKTTRAVQTEIAN